MQISITAARTNTGMNQREWAKAIGVSNYTVSNWETGHTVPNAIQLRKISEISGIPMDMIFFPDYTDKIVSEKSEGSA